MSEENLKHKTKVGLYWSFFNQFANNGLQFVVGIVMARLLSPEDYGITALPAVFMAIAGTLMDAGFSSAMVRKPELTEKDLSTSFYYSILVGITCYLAIFIAAPWIADFYNVPVLEPLVRVTALTFLWGPLSTPQSVILQRRLDFKTPARISVITKIIGSIIGITFAYLGYGLWALVIMGVVSSLLGLIQTWLVVRWLPKAGWSKDSFKYLWNFGNKIIATYILDQVYQNITPIVIGKYYSPAQLGQYNRAQGYADLPSKQVTGMVQGVTFPVLSKLQGDKEKLAEKYRMMIKTLSFVVTPIMLGLSALAYPVVVVLVGEKWAPCVIFLQVMCFTKCLYPIHSLNVNLLMVSGRSDIYLKLEIQKKFLGVIMLVVTLPISVMALVWGNLIYSIVLLVVNTHYTSKLINVSLLTQLKDVMPSWLLSFAMFMCVWGYAQLVDNHYVQIGGGFVIGAIVYLVGAYLFRFKEINEVKYMLNRKK